MAFHAPLAGTKAAGQLRLVDLRVQNLIAEPLVPPERTDSLFRILMSREELIGRADGPMVEYERCRNPLLSDTAAARGIVPISIDLELEQSWYGPRLDTQEQIRDFWFLGIPPVGRYREDQDPQGIVVAMIQWRARVSLPDERRPKVVVGVGKCSGPRSALDRRQAIHIANKRALWDLTWAITRALDDDLGLGLRRTPVGLRPKDYQAIAGDW